MSGDWTIVAARERIRGKWGPLNVDELSVVETVVDGLIEGRAIYGGLDIAQDERDFDAEAGYEMRDALIYSAIAALADQRRRG